MATRPKGAGSLYYSADGRWRGTIEAGWTTKGTRRRITVSAKTKAEAQRKMRDREREIARNGIPTEGSRRATTVKAWAEEWLPIQERTLRPQSYASTRSAVTKWIIPTIGHVKLATLNPGHIRSVHNAVRDAGLKPSSAVRTHAVLMALLNDALTEGGHTVPDAPLKVSGPKAGKSTRDAIPLEHALIVLQAALTRPDASRWVAALLQALRPAEARGLTWAHIDFDTDTIDISWQLKPVPYKVPRDRTSGFRVPDDYEATHLVDSYHLVRPKTDSGQRVIPMVPWMKAALLQWKETQGGSPYDLVWCRADGRPLTDKQDVAAWRTLCETAGVPAYDLYEARHTAATLLRKAGVDDETIIAIMGHATILSTKAYLHSDTERAREALQKVAQALQLEA